MNNDRAEGKFDEVKGKIKQSVGEAVGNDRLANSGAADQVKGSAKEAWGSTKDAFSSTGDSTRATTGSTVAGSQTGDAAHDVREKIVSGAKNLKDAITGETDGLRSRDRSA